VASLKKYISRLNWHISSGVPDKDMAAMELGLAHSLSRYKLKFSPDKIDTMIVQVAKSPQSANLFEIVLRV
jgi:RNA processing factor Prp31